MRPDKPKPPVINPTYLEDGKTTGTGAGLHTVQITYRRGNTELASRLIQVDQMGNWEDTAFAPDLAEGDKISALQYINEASKSDVVEWTLPPKMPTLNPISAGEGQHLEGTGIPNYYIHYTVKNPDGGGESTDSKVDEEGKWRSLNAINKLDVGATITLTQSKNEFPPEEQHSKKLVYTVS